MKQEIRINIEDDGRVMLIAEFRSYHDTTGDNENVQKCFSLDMESMHLIVFINGMDYDLTDGLNAEEYKYFENKAYEAAEQLDWEDE